MPIPAHDHDDGEFMAFDEARTTGRRLTLAAAILAYTATIFILGYWAGAL